MDDEFEYHHNKLLSKQLKDKKIIIKEWFNQYCNNILSNPKLYEDNVQLLQKKLDKNSNLVQLITLSKDSPDLSLPIPYDDFYYHLLNHQYRYKMKIKDVKHEWYNCVLFLSSGISSKNIYFYLYYDGSKCNII